MMRLCSLVAADFRKDADKCQVVEIPAYAVQEIAQNDDAIFVLQVKDAQEWIARIMKIRKCSYEHAILMTKSNESIINSLPNAVHIHNLDHMNFANSTIIKHG